MTGAPTGRGRPVMPAVAAISDNTYLSAVRAGIVVVVAVTIIGGLFAIVANLPVPAWEARVAPYQPLLQIPVTATFGVLAIVACLGLPIVLTPLFMIPYVLNALILTAVTYLLMEWSVIQKPFVNVPWTTPPIIGHYVVTGGD